MSSVAPIDPQFAPRSRAHRCAHRSAACVACASSPPRINQTRAVNGFGGNQPGLAWSSRHPYIRALSPAAPWLARVATFETRATASSTLVLPLTRPPSSPPPSPPARPRSRARPLARPNPAHHKRLPARPLAVTRDDARSRQADAKAASPMAEAN